MIPVCLRFAVWIAAKAKNAPMVFPVRAFCEPLEDRADKTKNVSHKNAASTKEMRSVFACVSKTANAHKIPVMISPIAAA